MIILDATNRSFEVILGEAHTANALPVICSYVDVTTTTYTPGTTATVTNGTTAITAAAAPASSTQRQIKLLTVYNEDTTEHAVYVRYNNNATLRNICKMSLSPGETLQYTDGEGFRKIANTSTGYILLQDQQAQNTQGGTFTSGSWVTRVLNTEVFDTGGNCSLSSNMFTLDAGTYEIYASAPALYTNSHQVRLYNVTDSAVVTGCLGTSEWSLGSANGDQTRSEIVSRFTLASSKQLRLEHRCQTTSATYGLGTAANQTTEIYAFVELHKVA